MKMMMMVWIVTIKTDIMTNDYKQITVIRLYELHGLNGLVIHITTCFLSNYYISYVVCRVEKTILKSKDRLVPVEFLF